MTPVAAATATPAAVVRRWLQRHDPELRNVRRSLRAAIVLPLVFALGDLVIDNTQLALFAALGTISTLLFADFAGDKRERLTAYVGLILGGAGLLCVGTLCSRNLWVATLATAAVAFVLLFIGIVSSVLATATTPLLISFILAATLPGGADTIPDRVGGWLLAGACSLAGLVLLWPPPSREPLRLLAADACRALADQLSAEVRCSESPETCTPAAGFAGCDVTAQRASDAVAILQKSFFAAPYRPTGLSTGARRFLQIVDQVIWLRAVVDRRAAHLHEVSMGGAASEVQLLTAQVLDAAGAELRTLDPSGRTLADLSDRLRAARQSMESAASSHQLPDADLVSVRGLDRALEPTFQAQEIAFVAAAIAENTDLVALDRQRSWLSAVLGSEGTGDVHWWRPAARRISAHLDRHSVWLHNSVRGAVAFALAVLVATAVGAEHSFWVAFGTLAVLRSSVLNTGQTALRALAGTTVGIALGGIVIYVVGTNHVVLWILLPFAVALMGMAPATISFAAGQAAFTIVIFILFSILAPEGWHLGLVRAEDVALGCLVSVGVGLVFWPRGASAVMRRAVSESLADGADHLQGAIESNLEAHSDALAARAGTAATKAVAAGLRLDDALRQFLTERGTKHLALAELTGLVSSLSILRQTSQAILVVADEGPEPATELPLARQELLAATACLTGWYHSAALALVAGPPSDGPATVMAGDPAGLVQEARTAMLSRLRTNDPAATVRLFWTAGYLEAVNQLRVSMQPALTTLISYQPGAVADVQA
jgi:uncharacterized membrane protein YccC